MKVVIFEKNNTFFSVICSLVTGSSYSHGSIYNEGKLYDTTFLRGYFAEAQGIKADRMVAVCEVDGNIQEWIDKNIGVKYDVWGLFFWWVGLVSLHKMYCFIVIKRSLLTVGVDLKHGERLSGSNIIKGLIESGYKVEIMRGKDFNGLYLK